ncbi:hypothetical protein BJ170DRAFT_598320 [Xylariales sp. AK1849]|nr:hypothetical protein BJ170DRAFT_598320 [Xylariales sp. AK1849]
MPSPSSSPQESVLIQQPCDDLACAPEYNVIEGVDYNNPCATGGCLLNQHCNSGGCEGGSMQELWNSVRAAVRSFLQGAAAHQTVKPVSQTQQGILSSTGSRHKDSDDLFRKSQEENVAAHSIMCPEWLTQSAICEESCQVEIREKRVRRDVRIVAVVLTEGKVSRG